MDGAHDIEINRDSLPSTHTITVPIQLKRCGVEMRIILPGQQDDNNNKDETLINPVACVHDWFEKLKVGISITEIAKANNIHLADASRSITEIAKANNIHLADASRFLPLALMPLAFLAPDIVTDILEGNHPVELTAEKPPNSPLSLALYPNYKHKTPQNCGAQGRYSSTMENQMTKWWGA